jgi:HK97 family phage major capsid protein
MKTNTPAFSWKGQPVYPPFGAEGTSTKAKPSTPKEWEEYVNTALSTPEKFKAAYESGEFVDMLKGYQGATNRTMDSIKAEVLEQVTASTMEMFKRNGVTGVDKNSLDLSDKAKAKAARTGALYNKSAQGAPADGVFDHMGQFVQDLLARQGGYASDEQLSRVKAHGESFRNYSSIVPSEGGYLVPEEYRADILTVALESAVVRPKATVVPMRSAKLKWPVVDMTTEVGEVYGGMVMYWVDEGETIPDTSAAFAAIELELHKLAGLASVPNELVRDAAALDTWLRRAMPNAVVHFEDIGFLKGNGVKKPLGALHEDNPALIVVGDESGQSTATITWNNVLAMFARLLPESYDNAEWIISPDCIPEIFTMALPVGTGGSAVMMGEGGGVNKLAQTMLGLPIRWSRKAPAALGTQGDISLVDLSTYVIGDGQEMRLDTSPHSSFRADKTDFRIIERVDGQPGLLSPITPENNGPTLSAYVQLETRSLD